MSYINKMTKAYPVSEQDIRALHPDTAFPVPFSPPEPFAWVFPSPTPAYDPISQYLVEEQPAVSKKGQYEQQFSVNTLPAEVAEANSAAYKAQLTRQFEQAIQNTLDSAAQVERYDSISTVISYAEEPAVIKFQNDGKRFRVWRSLVWAYAYDQLAKVLAGEREQPTIEAFLAELPALDIPA